MTARPASRRVAARLAWVLPAFGLAALALVLWQQLRQQDRRAESLRAELDRLEQQQRQSTRERDALQGERDALAARLGSLQADNRQMAARLALERSMPRGSLGDFFLAYEQFADALRFEVDLQVDYRVHWRLAEPPAGHPGKVTVARGRADRLQGVFLGRRSNFAFGLLALPDLSPALFLPAGDPALQPPAEELLERRWYWLDKTGDYVLADPPLERVVRIAVTAWGTHRPARPPAGQVLRLWREPDKGFSVLVIGLAVDEEGIDPGPPYLDEPGWLASTEGLKVFPLTAPNGGIVLAKEDLAQAYRRDRDRLPEVNSAWDFYRNGWLRSGWDGLPGRVEVLFAPLAPGPQTDLAPQVHSLVFPMLGRRAFWIPFWSIRERLLAPGRPDLALLPTFNTESRRLDYRLEHQPARAAGPWEPRAYQSALYDLLKRRPRAR